MPASFSVWIGDHVNQSVQNIRITLKDFLAAPDLEEADSWSVELLKDANFDNVRKQEQCWPENESS